MTISVLERYFTRLKSLGDDPRISLVGYFYAIALAVNSRYPEAIAVQRETSSMADRLPDSISKAYAFLCEMQVTTIVEPKPKHDFDLLGKRAIEVAAKTQDVFVQTCTRLVIGMEEVSRGRVSQARSSALELLELGRLANDPRATGLGLWLLSYIALLSDSYLEALEYSEQSLAVGLAPTDRMVASGLRAIAMVLLRQVEEGATALEAIRRDFVSVGFLYPLGVTDVPLGVCKVFQGNIANGIRLIESAVAKREQEGLLDAADLARLSLAEVYLQIIARTETPPLAVVARNLPVLLKVMAVGPARIHTLMSRVLRNPHFDPAGHHVGRAQMILGLLYKAKRKRALADQHLTEAKRIISQFGPTPMLAKIEAALAEVA